MQIKLRTHSNPLNIVNTYAPQNARPICEKQKYYKELEDTIEGNGTNSMDMICSDMNARIHSRLNGEEPWIGEHVFGGGEDYLESQNEEGLENREQLIDFCMSNDYLVMNTFVSQR